MLLTFSNEHEEMMYVCLALELPEPAEQKNHAA